MFTRDYHQLFHIELENLVLSKWVLKPRFCWWTGIKTSGTRRRISIGSFGRLKTQKVKAIATKSSSTNEKSSDDAHAPTFERGLPHISDRSQSKVKSMGEKKRVNASRHVDKFPRSSEHDRDRHHSSGPNLSRSEQGSAAYFRGWGSRGPYGSDYEPTKFSERGFYSRKSFKDLGCTEYMIESLRRQSFLRPSQIQVHDVYYRVMVLITM